MITSAKKIEPVPRAERTGSVASRAAKYALVAGVTAFFAVMWGLLLHKHLPAATTSRLRPNYGNLLRPGEEERTTLWGIYFGLARLGRSEMTIKRESGGTILIPRLASSTMGAVADACAYLEEATPTFANIGQRFGEKAHEELLSEIEAVYALHGNPMKLMPTIEGPLDGIAAVGQAYSSDRPDHNLTVAEMVTMIVEAEKDAE